MKSERHSSSWRLLGLIWFAVYSAETPRSARADATAAVPVALAACEFLEKLAEHCATYDQANDLYLVGQSRLAIDWLELPRKIQQFRQDVGFTSWESTGNAHSLEAQCVAATPQRVKLTSRSGKTAEVDVSKLNTSSAARALRIFKNGLWLQTRADRAKERLKAHLAKAPMSPVPLTETGVGAWTYALLREANATAGGSDRIYTEILPQLSTANQDSVLLKLVEFVAVESLAWEGKDRRVLIQTMHAKLLELAETALADQVKPPVVILQDMTVDELEDLQSAQARELSPRERAAIRAVLRDSQRVMPRIHGRERSLSYEVAALGTVIIQYKRRSRGGEYDAEAIRLLVETVFRQ